MPLLLRQEIGMMCREMSIGLLGVGFRRRRPGKDVRHGSAATGIQLDADP
jgi:hypothetical protein